MKESDVRVNGWSQQSMLPPEYLRIEVLVHLDVHGTKPRVGIHVSDPITDTVLGIYSASAPDTDAAVALATELLAAAISEHHSPF